ncbi:hypothetical protein MLD38_027386 [Melastoma candidum]|uniref:Uncharacterized protein n=1 Tax=Melastoma candidum TaxID=119954 RepID=A0ACB9P1D4_9MYRT|nr:hypothetical protein MLD38_027386 [Melastoma candidum]
MENYLFERVLVAFAIGSLASVGCGSLRANSFLFPARAIRCGGLRKEQLSTLWRNSDVPSREAIDAVHSLKLSKSKSTDQIVAAEKLGRLLKADVLNAFAELKRQNQVQLSLLARFLPLPQ